MTARKAPASSSPSSTPIQVGYFGQGCVNLRSLHKLTLGNPVEGRPLLQRHTGTPQVLARLVHVLNDLRVSWSVSNDGVPDFRLRNYE